MNQGEFMKLVAARKVDTYPFGSCQYKTVAKAYEVTKEVGPEKLAFLFGEDDYLDSMVNYRGKPDKLFKRAKANLVLNYLMTEDQAQADEQMLRLIEAVESELPLTSFIKEGDLDPDDEEVMGYIQKIWDTEDYQQLLDTCHFLAMDLWSMEIPVAWPELDPNILPDVGNGPLFNVMAWNDGYRTGIQMAFMEYLCEEDFDWGEWDT